MTWITQHSHTTQSNFHQLLSLWTRACCIRSHSPGSSADSVSAHTLLSFFFVSPRLLLSVRESVVSDHSLSPGPTASSVSTQTRLFAQVPLFLSKSLLWQAKSSEDVHRTKCELTCTHAHTRTICICQLRYRRNATFISDTNIAWPYVWNSGYVFKGHMACVSQQSQSQNAAEPVAKETEGKNGILTAYLSLTISVPLIVILPDIQSQEASKQSIVMI